MKDGFKAGYTYTLSYTGKKNTPVGRASDIQRSATSAPTSRNPATWFPRSASYVVGESQTGRLTAREFLYDGYNADEQGKKVFDLVWSHIAGAARGDFTQPFTLPNGLGIFTGSMFPYSPVPEKDPVTGKTDGLLVHMSKDVVPKVVFTNGDCEYWGGGRARALVTATLDGKKDAKLPDNVRVYMMAGTQHVIAAFPPNAGQAHGKRPIPTITAGRCGQFWTVWTSGCAWARHLRPAVIPTMPTALWSAQQDLHFPALPGVQSPSIVPEWLSRRPRRCSRRRLRFLSWSPKR